MLQYFLKGGPVMYPLLVCSIIALAVSLERFYHLRRAGINASRLMSQIKAKISRGGVEEALGICEETPGPVARVLAASLAAYDRNREEIREVVKASALVEIPRLERFMGLLSTMITVSPMLGLLGTISGLIKIFNVISGGEIGNYTALSAGIAEALITTFTGLLIAIPFMIVYNALSGKVDGIINEMEQRSIELVNYMKSRGETDAA
ncbi:MAG: MotA/TolQ/ExbB proton channel family protein [bacterium]|nr:MotA/TolQ/ExbB proton channel family protein [bacterium]